MDGLQLKAKDRKRNAEITTAYKQPVRSRGAVTSGPPIVHANVSATDASAIVID